MKKSTKTFKMEIFLIIHQMLTIQGGRITGNLHLFLILLYSFQIFYHEHSLILKAGESVEQQK